jgi:hypothetical protein|tara:strand:- start:5 stop:538 length:534 start_codon:yes stop_codon:yes gene_type:complete
MVQRIENAIPPMILEYLRTQVQNEERWSFSYPKGAVFEKKHPKLTIYDGTEISGSKFLEGISHMVLLMIYNKMIKDGNNFFKPQMLWCGASIKDKYRSDNLHTDHEKDIPKNMKVMKLLGLLHAEWPQEYGGNFYHGGQEHVLTPGTFLCFDPLIEHRAADINTTIKRIAIDFTVIA